MSDFEKFKSLASTHMKKEGSKTFKIAKFIPIWSKMPNLAHECENKWQLTKIFKGQLRVTSTKKGQKMTLKFASKGHCTERFWVSGQRSFTFRDLVGLEPGI